MEAEGIFSDTADGFPSHRNIYDSLYIHIMMCEETKLPKKDIYTTYADFKDASGEMNDRILFQLMKEYGFQDSYIATQLYSASDTYYMTIHGNTTPYIEAPFMVTHSPSFSLRSLWSPFYGD